MLSRYEKTIKSRYRLKRWHKGLSYLWYNYHRKFFGMLIMRGRKLQAYKRFLKLLFNLKKKEKIEPRHLFFIACLRVTPTLIIKKLHKGTRVILKPTLLTPNKKPGFVIKWFIKTLKDAHKKRNIVFNKLCELIILSIRRRGEIHKKKIQFYKLARVNRKPKMRFPKVRKFFIKRKKKFDTLFANFSNNILFFPKKLIFHFCRIIL